MIIWEGDVGIQAFFLKAGAVQVQSAGRIVMQVDVPMCFGEVGLLRDTRRTASVIALTMCDVLELSRARFDAVLKHFPDVGAQLRAKVERTVRSLHSILSRWRSKAAARRASSGAQVRGAPAVRRGGAPESRSRAGKAAAIPSSDDDAW